MRPYFKGVATGIVGTLLTIGSLGYAASATQLDVTLVPLRYLFDGTEKQPPADKPGFLWNSTTYVPLRFVTESLGKEVAFDQATWTIRINTPTPQPPPAPARFTGSLYIQGAKWTETYAPFQQDGDTLYVSFGDLQRLGLDIQITQNPTTITYRKGAQAVTISETGTAVNGKAFAAAGLRIEHGRSFIPLTVLAQAFGGRVEARGGDIHITFPADFFYLPLSAAEISPKKIVAQLPDGNRYLMNHWASYQYRLDGDRLYAPIMLVEQALAIQEGRYRTTASTLPGGLKGSIEPEATYTSFEPKFFDMNDINSKVYIDIALKAPGGQTYQFSTKDAPMELRENIHLPAPLPINELFRRLGIKANASFDTQTGVLTVILQ